MSEVSAVRSSVGGEDPEDDHRQPPSDTVWQATVPKVRELLALPYAPQGSDEWHAMRKRMLTASDVATALGENRYQSAKTLFRSKTNKIPYERQFRGNYATRWGHRYEPVARDEYERRTGEFVYAFSLVSHPTIPWLGGSCDGITATGRLIEIKCPTSREITHQVPSHYVPQVQTLLEVLDLEVCDFVQFKPAGPRQESMQFDVVTVKRDRNWFAQNLPTLREFWDRVVDERTREDAYQEAAATYLQCLVRQKQAKNRVRRARLAFRSVLRHVAQPVRDPFPHRRRRPTARGANDQFAFVF